MVAVECLDARTDKRHRRRSVHRQSSRYFIKEASGVDEVEFGGGKDSSSRRGRASSKLARASVGRLCFSCAIPARDQDTQDELEGEDEPCRQRLRICSITDQIFPPFKSEVRTFTPPALVVDSAVAGRWVEVNSLLSFARVSVVTRMHFACLIKLMQSWNWPSA